MAEGDLSREVRIVLREGAQPLAAAIATRTQEDRFAARILKPNGEEFCDRTAAVDLVLKREHAGARRAEEILIEALTRRLEVNGGRLLSGA